MSKMRQVTKEEFEILTRFHPGEIRYYVDIGRATNRTKGAKVNVKRKPQTRKKKASKKKSAKKSGVVNGTGHGLNQPVRYTGKEAGYMTSSTISIEVEKQVKEVFAGDPTRIIGRSDLTKIIDKRSDLSMEQINPVISDLLSRGVIAYKKSAAS